MDLPEGTRGKFVAVALVLIPLILVYQIVLSPLLDEYLGVGDEIEALQADIQRYQRIIAELPAIEENAARFRRENPLAPYLLEGGNPALAAANLQRRLQEVAARNDARVVSVQVQSSEDDGPLQRVAIQARIQADSEALRGTLHELESGQPYLFVDDISINVRPASRRTETDTMEIRITLSGLRSPEPLALNGARNG